jgi:plastocyanin
MRSWRALTAGALTTIALGAIVVPGVVGADERQQSKTVNVDVADDYFAPSSMKVKKGTKVKWVWNDSNTNTHNVVLTSKHPNGVKASDFRSGSGAVNMSFKRKLTKKGKYGFVCTFHSSVMTQTIKVTK